MYNRHSWYLCVKPIKDMIINIYYIHYAFAYIHTTTDMQIHNSHINMYCTNMEGGGVCKWNIDYPNHNLHNHTLFQSFEGGGINLYARRERGIIWTNTFRTFDKQKVPNLKCTKLTSKITESMKTSSPQHKMILKI